MVDLSDTGSGTEETLTPERVSSGTSQIKTCADCGTTKTPLWRGGPAGPKSLCNACGIRSRKKRRALLGLNKDDKRSKKSVGSGNKNVGQKQSSNSSTSSSGYNSTSSDGGKKKNDSSLKRRLFPFGGEVVLQRPRSSSTHKRKLGEEEQAAFLLMALSCGSVYA